MDANRVLQHVRNELAKIKQEQSDFLASGRVTDFAEYRHICGVIRGLGHADGFIADLAKKMEFSDDD
jgi:hypothetical protein